MLGLKLQAAGNSNQFRIPREPGLGMHVVYSLLTDKYLLFGISRRLNQPTGGKRNERLTR